MTLSSPVFRRAAASHAASRLAFLLVGLGLAVPRPSPGVSPTGLHLPCRESISELYQRVSPAVVSIVATAIDPYDSSRMQRQAGSGVIIDSSGLILTNSHLVFEHPVLQVTLDDGTTLPARIAGADPLFDVALVRVAPPSSGGLPTAELSDSDRLLPGDEVYAIGNPFGLEQTLTRGIVSAVNRILPGVSWSFREPLIQTDAAINEGSSGGPLIDRCGDVVGITTAILPDAQGIGFAIPTTLVRDLLPDLIKNGRVIRPWLGVQGQFVPPDLKKILRLSLVDGLLIEVVEPGSPASRSGIEGGNLDVTVGGKPFLVGGDILTEIDGAPAADQDQLNRALASLKIGATVRLTLYRDQKTRRVDVLIAERPVQKADIAGQRALIPRAGRPRPGPADADRRRQGF